MSLFKWFTTYEIVALPAKDPLDWTLTASSTEWDTDYCCSRCKHSTSHREQMAKICNRCGFFGKWMVELMQPKTTRRIWNGAKWVYQTRYGNGEKDFVISDEAPK